MADPTRRRWWPLLLTVALVAAIAAWFVWKTEVDRRAAAWEGVRARAASVAKLLPAGPRPHVPMLGEATAGRADEHYARAEQLYRDAKALSPTDAFDVIAVADQPDLPEHADEVLAPLGSTLGELAAGAASASIDCRSMGVRLLDDGLLLGSGHVIRVAKLAIRNDLAKGRHASAIQHSADLLTLGRDQFACGLGIYDCLGDYCLVSVCDLWTDKDLLALLPPSRRELAALLARLDDAVRPATLGAPGEFLWVLGNAGSPKAKSWGRAQPEHMHAYLAAFDALAATDESGWTERQQALATLTAPLADLPWSRFLEIEQSRRQALAAVRLLRLGLAYHLGEAMPSLRDPLGDGDLQATEVGESIRFHSRGRVDDKPIERLTRRR